MKLKFSIHFISVLLVISVLISVIICCVFRNQSENSAADKSDDSKNASSVLPSAESDETESPEVSTQPPLVMPSQNYVGTWYTDETKAVALRILKITSDSIVFQAIPSAGGFYFQATAAEIDGKFVFGDETLPDSLCPEEMTGRLEFEDNSITVVYDTFGLSETENYPPEGTVCKFTIKSEIDVIDWPTNELSAPIASYIQNTIDELESKGWTDIEVFPHEPDSRNRWGVIVESYDLEEGSVLYTVTGLSGSIFVVVEIVFDNETSEGQLAEVYYVSICGGRLLIGKDLDSFLKNWSKPDIIMYAYDKEMYYYFGMRVEK